jgi:hypothetical protein
MVSKLIGVSLLFIVFSLANLPTADGLFGPGCVSCLLGHLGEAAGACAISGPGYVLCLLGLIGIKGAIVCGIVCGLL